MANWDTDELADSQVEFGESTLLGRTARDATPTESHAVTLPQLEPARTYYYRIVTTDRAGNITVDDNNGALHQFSTLQPRQPPWTDNMEGTITNWTVYTVDESERGWERGVPGIASPPAHSDYNSHAGPPALAVALDGRLGRRHVHGLAVALLSAGWSRLSG